MKKDLYYLINNNNVDEIKNCLKQFDLNNVSDLGDTVLMASIRNNSLEILKILLESGANPNISDSGGWFPLHFAVQKGCIDIVKTLIDFGADINKGDLNTERTPLQVAITSNSSNKQIIVDFLVSNGADLNKQNIKGVSSIRLAEIYGVPLNNKMP
jgi:ankyrin repeat protein